MRSESDERQFADFPSVSTEAWERAIRDDLGDRDYARTLLREVVPGINLRAYYRAEDLDRLLHLGGQSSVDVSASWTVRQDITLGRIESTRRHVVDAVAGGAEIIGFDVRNADDEPDALAAVLRSADLSNAGVHALGSVRQHPALRSAFDPNAVTLILDPLSAAVRKGALEDGQMDEAAASLTDDNVLVCAAADAFHDAGANLVQSTALFLASISEYLVQFGNRGVSSDRVVGRLVGSIPVESSYFPEIARMRALRLLIPQVLSAFDLSAVRHHVPIHASTSVRNATLYDSHSNLLRATTEAASAVLGGCDVLNVRPFDKVSGRSTAKSYRLARNIQHLLRHESHLDRVSDPAAGSYYVERLTDEIARSAWRSFQQIEARGGLLNVIRNGWLRRYLAEAQDSLFDDVAHRRRILVGTNQYPDPNERLLGNAPDALPTPDRVGTAPGLRRSAEKIEAVRLRTERHAVSSGRRIIALVLPIGNRSVRNTRSRFAANFLACGGIETRELDAAEEAESGVEICRGVEAHLLVVAAPDEIYAPKLIGELRRATTVSAIGVVGKRDVSVEADFTLYRGADVVETLRTIQNTIFAEEG